MSDAPANLCKVSFLRSKGVRRPDDEVKAGPWFVGAVSLDPSPGIRKGSPIALLMAPDGKIEPIATIFDVRVRMNPRGLLLSGVEEVWDRKRKTVYRQSWWCLPCSPIPIPSDQLGDDGSGYLIGCRVPRYVSVFDVNSESEPVILRIKGEPVLG